jgi:hypothetical protein
MIHDDFRMHRARVFLCSILLTIVIVPVLPMRAIGVNRPYLRARSDRHQRDGAHD